MQLLIDYLDSVLTSEVLLNIPHKSILIHVLFLLREHRNGSVLFLIRCVALEALLPLESLSFIVHFLNFTSFFSVALSTSFHQNIAQFIFSKFGGILRGLIIGLLRDRAE